MTDILQLIKTSAGGIDDQGDLVTTEDKRQVFCGVQSVGMSETYQAMALGLKPEIKFVLADYLDYQGEQLLEHEGTRYRVLRTFRKGKTLELTCYTEVNQS